MPVQEEGANVLSPNINKIAVLSVTTGSTRADLAAAGQLNGEESKGFITLKADGGKVWFFFNNADAGTADEAETGAGTPANRTFMIADGESFRCRLRDGATWIVMKGSVACKLRVYRSGSLGPGTD